MLLALRGCPLVGPGLLPARKNRSLASRTSEGAPFLDILKTMPFEPNVRPVFQKKGLVGKKDGVRPVEPM